jgi:hypothetical protein
LFSRKSRADHGSQWFRDPAFKTLQFANHGYILDQSAAGTQIGRPRLAGPFASSGWTIVVPIEE